MDESLLNAIRDAAAERSLPFPFDVAPEPDIAAAEATLGFPIPTPLRAVYRRLGNGGFGPGRGGNLIGVRGGYASDFGTLVETYWQLRRDCESEGGTWRAGLLPFCEWGCNIFSCVCCNEPSYPIWLFREGDVWPQGFILDEFLQMWAAGADLLA